MGEWAGVYYWSDLRRGNGRKLRCRQAVLEGDAHNLASLSDSKLIEELLEDFSTDPSEHFKSLAIWRLVPTACHALQHRLLSFCEFPRFESTLRRVDRRVRRSFQDWIVP